MNFLILDDMVRIVMHFFHERLRYPQYILMKWKTITEKQKKANKKDNLSVDRQIVC